MLASGGWQAFPHAHSTSWVIPLHGQGKPSGDASTLHSRILSIALPSLMQGAEIILLTHRLGFPIVFLMQQAGEPFSVTTISL